MLADNMLFILILNNFPERLWSRGSRSHFFRLQLRSRIWVRIRVRQYFRFDNPTPVQTPASIIDPTIIYLYFYLKNDHTDSCYYRNWKVTPDPGPVFPKILTPDPGPKEMQNPAGVQSGTPDPVPPVVRTYILHHCSGISRAWHVPWGLLWRARKNCLDKIRIRTKLWYCDITRRSDIAIE